MPSGSLPQLHGFLIVDKPFGWTSHDVVGRVRRLTGVKRVGHAGTLDPFATGVLVIAVGKATRLLQYSDFEEKRYLAQVVLGAETDSADIDGRLQARTVVDAWPEIDAVHTVVRRFIGQIEQVPPAHSAIKVDGQPLYRRARAGEDVDVPIRTVTIHQIEVVDYQPPSLFLDVRCESGTYIRSVARDIGDLLHLGGYCHALRRVQVGAMSIEDAWTVAELEDSDLREHWSRVALHPDAGLVALPAVILSEVQTGAWYHGSLIKPDQAPSAMPVPSVRVYGADGRFLGVGTMNEQGDLMPKLVFVTDSEGNTQ